MSLTEAPKRGRPPRQAETQQRRRRREDMGDDRHLKLAVPASLKEEGFVYRWINETPGRIENKTVHDDWDIVKSEIDPEKDNGEGSPVRRAVGTAADGKALYAYLCRKPKDYYQADKKAEQGQIAEDEKNLRRGQVKGSEALAGPHAYVPESGIKITHGDDD
jgi:hypothetical protein